MVPVEAALEPSGQPPQPPAPTPSPDRESPGWATPDEDWRPAAFPLSGPLDHSMEDGLVLQKETQAHVPRRSSGSGVAAARRLRSARQPRARGREPPKVAARGGFALAARVQPGPEAGQPIARTRAGRKPGSGLPGAPRPRRGAVPASSGRPRPGISSSSLRAARRPDRGWARVRPRPVGKRGPPPPRRPRRALGPQGLGAAGPGADSERRGPRAGGGRRRRRRKRRRKEGMEERRKHFLGP